MTQNNDAIRDFIPVALAARGKDISAPRCLFLGIVAWFMDKANKPSWEVVEFADGKPYVRFCGARVFSEDY